MVSSLENPYTSMSKEEFLILVLGVFQEEPSTEIAGDGVYIRPALWTLSLNSQN